MNLNKKILLGLSIATIAILSACGDSATGSDLELSSSSSDNAISSSSSNDGISSSSSDDVISSSSIITTKTKIFMHTSDGTTGALCWKDIAANDFDENDKLAFEANSIIKFNNEDKYLYMLERTTSNIVKIDPNKEGTDMVVYQKAIVSSTMNPEDIAFAGGNKAYISAYTNNTGLYEVDLSTGNIVDSIDLSGYAYNDQNFPGVEQLLYKDGKIYAGIQRQNAYSVDTTGIIAIINTSDNSIEGDIELQHGNPMSITELSGKIYVCSHGPYGYTNDEGTYISATNDNLRGIELLDLETLTSSVVVNGEELGGAPAALVGTDANNAYISIYKAWGSQPIAKINLETKTISEYTEVVNAFGGLFYDSEVGLLIGEQSAADSKSGLYIFNDNTFSSLLGASLVQPYGFSVANY